MRAGAPGHAGGTVSGGVAPTEWCQVSGRGRRLGSVARSEWVLRMAGARHYHRRRPARISVSTNTHPAQSEVQAGSRDKDATPSGWGGGQALVLPNLFDFDLLLHCARAVSRCVQMEVSLMMVQR